MSEYRVRATGEVKSQGQIRKDYPNTSLPRVWKRPTLDFLGVDPVLVTPKPDPSDQWNTVVRNGVEQDSKGNWVYAWTERAMFTEYTDENGNTVTVESQKTAYTEKINSQVGTQVRSTRDQLLSETDYLALSDNTLTTEMATYRQALRDITSHSSFPFLSDSDWPVKPE